MAPLRRLLICSIGNPGVYARTRHSAGHLVLNQLSPHLHSIRTTLSNDRSYGGALALDPDPDKTFNLFQSPKLMNVSGGAVASAWKSFKLDMHPGERPSAMLVVLHDELEKPLGKIKLKTSGSAGGHNGITSCIQSLGTHEFHRIGIGISRPSSKDPKVVSDYVLGPFTQREMDKLEDESLPKVIEMLRKLAKEPMTANKL